MSSMGERLGSSAWRRLLVTWLALAVVMSLNGIMREVMLMPVAGPRWAPVASAGLGIVVLLAVTRALFPPLAGYSPRVLGAVSAVLVLLTVTFETALGLFVDGRSWRAMLEHYALWRGELWPLVLATLALTPLIWGRWWPPAESTSEAHA